MEKSLHRYGWFIAAWVVPVILAIALAAIIYYDTRPVVSFTADGVSKLYELFKVPLWTLACAFPLTALVASVHRARQTDSQIALIVGQNTMTNYFKHRDEFYELLSNLERKHDISFADRVEAYKTLFPQNSYERFSIKPVYGEADPFTAAEGGLHSISQLEVFECPTEDGVKEFYDRLFNVSQMVKFSPNNMPQQGEERYTNLLYWSGGGPICFECSDVLRHWSVILDVYKKLAEFSFNQGLRGCGVPVVSEDFERIARRLFLEVSWRQFQDEHKMSSAVEYADMLINKQQYADLQEANLKLHDENSKLKREITELEGQLGRAREEFRLHQQTCAFNR